MLSNAGNFTPDSHSLIYFTIYQKYNKIKCGKGKEAYIEAGGL